MTQTGKQKPSHPLLPLPPCLAAAPCPQPTVGSLFWSPEPRHPCSLEAQTQTGKGGVGVPRPPCSVSHSGQDQPPTSPLGPPRNLVLCPPWKEPLPLLGACLELGSQGWYPVLSPAMAKVTPQANGTVKDQRQLETPRAARCPRRRTSHLALCTPKESPGLETGHTEQIPAQCSGEPRCSLCTGDN